MTGLQPPNPPQLQYFQPRGPFLPPVRWRQRAHGWVWVVSVVAALLLAGIAVAALLAGALAGSRFTAHGAVQVDCRTQQSIDGQPVGLGSAVRISEVDTGVVVSTTELDRFQELGAGACFASFQVNDLAVAEGGYLVKLGDLPGRLTSAEALEQGVLFQG